MKQIFSLVLIIITLSKQNADAQLDKGTFLLGGNGSYQKSENASFFSLNPNVGIFIFDKYAAGLSTSYSKTASSKFLSLGPYVRAYFLASEAGSAFASASFSYFNLGVNNQNISDSGFSLGIGYAIFLSNSIALELSGIYSKFGLNKNTSGIFSDQTFSFNIGFQIHFRNLPSEQKEKKLKSN